MAEFAILDHSWVDRFGQEWAHVEETWKASPDSRVAETGGGAKIAGSSVKSEVRLRQFLFAK